MRRTLPRSARTFTRGRKPSTLFAQARGPGKEFLSVDKSAKIVPARLPPSLQQGIQQTRPLDVTWRKDMWPELPMFSDSPATDPEMFDQSKTKRMPVSMEKDLDRWRLRGFFPGDPHVARTHYLSAMREWRTRIRGFTGHVFSRRIESWREAPRKVHILDYHARHHLPLDPRVVFEASPFRGLQAIKARIAEFEVGDLDAEKVQKVYRTTPERLLARKLPFEKIAEVVDVHKVNARIGAIPESSRRKYRTSLVGQRIYLPNIIVRLVRNYTPKGQEYNPHMATFRIPLGMTKTDLRSYLKTLYNLDVSFIRTTVRRGDIVRDQQTGRRVRQRGFTRNHKRAVVGLFEPFHYPDDVDEIRAISRSLGRGDEMYKARLAALDDNYFLTENALQRKKIIQRAYKKATRYRAKGENHLGRTIRTIMHRRKVREEAIQSEGRKLRHRANPTMMA